MAQWRTGKTTTCERTLSCGSCRIQEKRKQTTDRRRETTLARPLLSKLDKTRSVCGSMLVHLRDYFIFIFMFAAEGLRRERTPSKARRKKKSEASDRRRGRARAQHRLIGSRHQTHHATRCYREHSASRRRDGIFEFARRILGSASRQTTRWSGKSCIIF